MAIVTRSDEGKMPMADENRPSREADDREEREEAVQRSEGGERESRAAAPAGKPGFFTLYKPGQGKWTRLGTAAGSIIIVLLIAQLIFRELQTRTRLDLVVNPTTNVEEAGFPIVKLAISGSFALVCLLLLWRYQNKPEVVDFLIATESEMKKVNWTSRKDLFGSTRVVIVFMFLISAILFVIDVLFGYFFYLIHVLRTPPI